MPLTMARPVKDPNTGIYWFRKVVPEALRPLIGKREEKRSLKTRDPSEAKRLHAVVALEVEAEWARRQSVGATHGKARAAAARTEREAHERARWMEHHWISLHRENPSQQRFWRSELYNRLWRPFITLSELFGTSAAEKLSEREQDTVHRMENWCLKQADDYALLHDWDLDEESRRKLAKAFGAAVQRATLKLARYAQGDFDEDEKQRRATPTGADQNSVKSPNAGKPLSITSLLEAWWQEAQATGRKRSTYENYRNSIAALVGFLQHDDATRVTTEDVVAFKDHRLTTPSRRTGQVPSPKTVKDSDLAALKMVFGWAVANRKIDANPAAGITIKLGKERRLRPKHLTDEEAHAILNAASNLQQGGESLRMFNAKRWVPWLCALTGARVGELAQLRKQDLRKQGDYWVLRITPEAGTVKTNEAREIVLHPQLIELGFTRFVERCSDGPLFLTPSATGDVLGPLRGVKNRLAEFSRAIVSDPNVAPNHGWRHRFKTVGIEVGVSDRVLDAIQGQAPRTVADRYGEVSLKAKADAIAKFPYYIVQEFRSSAAEKTDILPLPKRDR
jgi:integrase